MPPAVIGAKPLYVIPRSLLRGGFMMKNGPKHGLERVSKSILATEITELGPRVHKEKVRELLRDLRGQIEPGGF